MAGPIARLLPIHPPGDLAAWPEILSEPARGLIEYWASECDGGHFPARAGIDPGELQDVLPWIFIVQRLAGAVSDYRFQLVGTQIVEIEGECTGRLLSELFPERDRYDRLWKQYDDCCAGKIHLRHENLGWKGKKHIDYQVVLLPLLGGTGEVEYLIGAAYSTMTLD